MRQRDRPAFMLCSVCPNDFTLEKVTWELRSAENRAWVAVGHLDLSHCQDRLKRWWVLLLQDSTLWRRLQNKASQDKRALGLSSSCPLASFQRVEAGITRCDLQGNFQNILLNADMKLTQTSLPTWELDLGVIIEHYDPSHTHSLSCQRILNYTLLIWSKWFKSHCKISSWKPRRLLLILNLNRQSST